MADNKKAVDDEKTLFFDDSGSRDDECDPAVYINFASEDMIHRCLELPAVPNIGSGRSFVPAINQGTDAAQSKRNLVRWLDEVVLAKTKIDPRTRDLSGNVIPGRYAGLRQSEYALIEQAISSVAEWASECVAGRISCGNFLVNWSSGRGSSTEECILIGPFQKT